MNTVNTWLWVATIGMALGAAGFLAYGVTHRSAEEREEAHSLLTFFIPLVATVAYLAMALGQGTFMLGGREVYWGRYADWVITTPLLLTHFVLLMGIRRPLAIGLLLSDVFMIVTGFAGELADHDHHINYLWWAISTGAFVAIIVILVTGSPGLPGRQGPRNALLKPGSAWACCLSSGSSTPSSG